MSEQQPSETTGRFEVQVERYLSHPVEHVWSALTEPGRLSQWYPLTVVEMDLQVGGRVVFDDGEGTTYQGTIQKLDPPHTFSFTEENDLLHIQLERDGEGCRLTFTHTFDDPSIADSVETGWNRCLDELERML